MIYLPFFTSHTIGLGFIDDIIYLMFDINGVFFD
jgi:hypothetical protein